MHCRETIYCYRAIFHFHYKTNESFQKKPEKPKWSEEQIESAIKIQKAYREYRQRKIEEDAKKKKEEMDRLMEEVNISALKVKSYCLLCQSGPMVPVHRTYNS